jgi:phosphoglycerate dehydrogenase-like enzyme
MKQTDILISAIPQTDKTRGMIKMKHLRMLGKDGLLVNVGRGDSIKEEALYKAIKENLIAGAPIDVWYDYDPKPDRKGRKYPYNFPFHKLDNTVISPHRAASPFDDLDRWDDVIENLSRLAQGKRKFLNEVDVREGY